MDNGKEPFITAYRGADGHSSGGGYLGAVALKYIRQHAPGRESTVAWGVHKYGHDFECNILLEGFDHVDADRLSQAFGIDYMSNSPGAFYYSDAWKAMQEWGEANPRMVRNGENGTHIAWVSRLGMPDQELPERSGKRHELSHSLRDYMISKILDTDENDEPIVIKTSRRRG